MAGYATTARLHCPAVRHRGAVASPPESPPTPSPVVVDEPIIEPLDRLPTRGRLADLRAAWARTTFYLFSPDSWR